MLSSGDRSRTVPPSVPRKSDSEESATDSKLVLGKLGTTPSSDPSKSLPVDEGCARKGIRWSFLHREEDAVNRAITQKIAAAAGFVSEVLHYAHHLTIDSQGGAPTPKDYKTLMLM
jgi:hypothetical protein